MRKRLSNCGEDQLTEVDDMGDRTESQTPGPEPERLELPHEDWKDAVRESLEGDRPADDEEDSAEEDRGETGGSNDPKP